MKGFVAFIISYDKERYLEECVYYIQRLQMPYGMDAEIIPVYGKTEFAECCLEAEGKSNAEYKVYLDQHTLIVNDLFLYDLLMEFEKNPEADAVGILGGRDGDNIDQGRVWIWDERGITDLNYQKEEITQSVCEASSMLLAVRYKEKRGMGGALYEHAVIPYQKTGWCIYDCCQEMTEAEEEYRFMTGRAGNCRDMLAVAAVERLLSRGQLAYEEHRNYVEKNAVGKGSIAGYFWEDSLLVERKWKKYLPADGRVPVGDRTKCGMNVVLAFNHTYAVYAAVMLQSLYDNNPLCHIHVHVLQNDLTLEDKQGLEKQAEDEDNRISFYALDRSVVPQNAAVTQEWPAEAYFRLFMTDILPKETDRILYLDVDIIVNKPIYDFYFMDMKGYAIVGCRDFSMILKEDFQDKRKELFAAVREEEDFTYINSGVMLVDLCALREKICPEDYLKMLREQSGKLLAPDQDIINLIHWKDTGLVDEYRYDFFNGCFKGVGMEEVKQYVSIVHYAGAKPWMVRDIDVHAHKLWWEYAVKTVMAQKLVYEMICSEKKLILEQGNLIEKMKYCRHVPLMSCEASGIKYVGSSLDLCIMRIMYETGENWSKNEIDLFFQLTEWFYGYSAEEADGIFLDVGGNIGTTSLYVSKKKAPQLKVIAFEPVRDNIRIFKANCALNDIAGGRIMLVEKAVSNQEISNVMEKNVFNPGMSRVVQEADGKGSNTETVESISLDRYLEAEGISGKEIRYLWIDVEGYEGYVIDGAKKMLMEANIPVMMEFVPQYLRRQGCYDMLIEGLSALYSHFIYIEEFAEGETIRIREIGTLREFGEAMGDGQGDIFLIKELRNGNKGAIN